MFHPDIKQTGISLAIALVMLMVISLLSLTALQVAGFEQKMTNQITDKYLSFQAAETALVTAETGLMAFVQQPTAKTSCAAPLCVNSLIRQDLRQHTAAWWLNNAQPYPSQLLHHSQPPRYVIEHYRFIPDNPTIGNGIRSGLTYFRVSSRGTAGHNNSAVSMLQTTAVRRLK
jgi:type IV pilus assembly protein PilX